MSVKSSFDPTFLAVDFFCGAGGTTRGLLDAGGYVIAGIDRDPQCETTYVSNNQNTKLDRRPPHFLNRDIFPSTADYPGGQKSRLERELGALVERYTLMAPRAPMIFAICAPCQPFTTLAKKTLSSDRTDKRKRDMNLLREALYFVGKFRPDLVLSENVAGISDAKFGNIWRDFSKGLRKFGYSVGSDVVCASKFGVPQFRKRSILVAARTDKVKPAFQDAANLAIPLSDPDAMIIDVRSAIGHFPPIKAGELHESIPNHRARTLSETNLKRIASARPGESNSYLASTKFGDLSLVCHQRAKEKMKVNCFTDVYTRMSPSRPSPTITTKCHSISNGRFGHYDVTQNRGISLREAAALQSFPDGYIFDPPTSVEVVARMVGNAVPPRLAKFFAQHAISLLDRRRFLGTRAQ
jgi:DNA (cytosine-5)-methyltransferase 1